MKHLGLVVLFIHVLYVPAANGLPTTKMRPLSVKLAQPPRMRLNGQVPRLGVVLFVNRYFNVSPIALSSGIASLISGFDIGIIAGALLLLVPAFHLERSPHR